MITSKLKKNLEEWETLKDSGKLTMDGISEILMDALKLNQSQKEEHFICF